MLNTERIVPVTKTDLLTLYLSIFEIADLKVEVVKQEYRRADGVFGTLGAYDGNYFFTEPVKRITLDGPIPGYMRLIFIPAYGFEGVFMIGEDDDEEIPLTLYLGPDETVEENYKEALEKGGQTLYVVTSRGITPFGVGASPMRDAGGVEQ